MSVITNLPAMPNRLAILCRQVASAGRRGETRDDLLACLAPASMQRGAGDEDETSVGSTMADHVLREALLLGLVVEEGDPPRLRLTFTFPDAGTAREEDVMLARFEAILLDQDAAERVKQADVPLAVAWILTRDPLTPPSWHVNVKKTVLDEFPASGAFELTSDSRYDNAVYWARHLGYAWRMSVKERKVVVPDPTAALARHLPRLMAAEKPVHVADLASRWAGPCPVLEGGWARTTVEDMQVAAHSRPAGQLSRSTSMALKRLADRGVLRLERRADADAWLLDVGGILEAISHVTLRSP